MSLNFRPVVWVTVEKASELTGRSVDSFNHLVRDGRLIEGTHWKWSPDNRRHINLEAYDKWVEISNSKGSTRGRRPSSSASNGTAAKRLATFIVPTGAHLVLGAIAPSRFYAVEFAKTVDRCKEVCRGVR